MKLGAFGSRVPIASPRARYMCSLAGVLCATAVAAQPIEPVAEVTREALALCATADNVPASQRPIVLAASLARAEEAVRVTPRDPVAHFAVFCSLGRRLELSSSRAGLLSAWNDLRRARGELDIALALAPQYPGALAAKGEMLMRLPWFLGGDRQEGERLIQRASALAPDDPQIRITLANVLQPSRE